MVASFAVRCTPAPHNSNEREPVRAMNASIAAAFRWRFHLEKCTTAFDIKLVTDETLHAARDIRQFPVLLVSQRRVPWGGGV